MLNKLNQIIQLIKNEIDHTVIINIIEDSKTCLDNEFLSLEYDIHISETQHKLLSQYQEKYFKPLFDNEQLYSFLPVYIIPFLHEIGHIMTDYDKDDYIYNKPSKTYEGYVEYRNIRSEKLADEWAMNIINKYGFEIASICTNETIEMIKILCGEF